MRRFEITPILLAWTAAVAAGDAAEVEVYCVDAAASDLHWRIYRAGVFAGLGHNHVISVGEFSGVVRRNPAGESSFELTIPVAGLVVDEPELRARYGDRFESEPSAEDIAGTRRNMLGRKVLDADRYPEIQVNGTLTATAPCEFAVTADLRGRDIALSVPCELSEDNETLIASGEFSLTHSELEMKPFKVMLGALAVAQRLDFSYRVGAVRCASPGTGPAAP